MMLTGMTTVVPSGLLIPKANSSRASIMRPRRVSIGQSRKVLGQIHLFRFLEGLLPQATSTNTRVMLISKPLTNTMLHLNVVGLPNNKDLLAVTDAIPLNT